MGSFLGGGGGEKGKRKDPAFDLEPAKKIPELKNNSRTSSSYSQVHVQAAKGFCINITKYNTKETGEKLAGIMRGKNLLMPLVGWVQKREKRNGLDSHACLTGYFHSLRIAMDFSSFSYSHFRLPQVVGLKPCLSAFS